MDSPAGSNDRSHAGRAGRACSLSAATEGSRITDGTGRHGLPYAIAFFAAAAIVLRFLDLSRESLWFDEGWTWWLVSHRPGEMLRLIRADNVAPAYFYLLNAWTMCFGDDAGPLRALSALLACATLIPLAIVMRRCELSRKAQLVIVLFTAFSCMQIQYAHEARPYALMAFATMAGLACVPTLASRRSIPAMLGFAASITLGMYTHNAMAFYAVCLAVAWLIWPGERLLRGRMIDLAIVVVISVIAYLPWLPVLREQLRFVVDHFWAQRPTASDGLIAASNVAGVDVYDANQMLWSIVGRGPGAGTIAVVCSVLFVVAVAFACWSRDVNARRRGLALGVVTLGPMVLVFAYSFVAQPIFLVRLFLPSAVLVPVVLAMSVDRGRRRSVRVTSAGIALVLGTLGVLSTTTLLTQAKKEDWRGAHDYVAHLPAAKRLLVFVATEGELPYLHYATRDAQEPQPDRTGTPGGFFDIDPPHTVRRVMSERDLESLKAKLGSDHYTEAILILSHDAWADPNGLTRAWFESHGSLVELRELRGVTILRFEFR